MWFGFDPLGRCVKRWIGPASAGTSGYTPATFFSYDGWNMIQEGASAPSADRVYVHGGRVDEIVASQVSGTWYNHHYDAQGNCILLSTATGGIQEQYDYDAFGFPYFYTASGATPGNVKTRFLFTGREWISDLRIYDYRNRQYQPELGRFLQPDPQAFAAGDYNLYRYCHNDPVNRNDPLGLLESPAWMQAIIPGQTEWDAAVNNFQAGNYGTAAAHTVAMLGQQVMFAYTLGASQRMNAPLQVARTTMTAAQAATQTSRVTLQEGNVFLAVVTKEGQIAGTASAGASHASLVQRLFGTGGLPKGASAVTIIKVNGQIVVLNSKTFSGNQLPAAKGVLAAIKDKYQ